MNREIKFFVQKSGPRKAWVSGGKKDTEIVKT